MYVNVVFVFLLYLYFFVFPEPVFSRLTFRVVMYLSVRRQIFWECRVEQDRLGERLFTIALQYFALQIHKYTSGNTKNTQIHKWKYKNTQIHKYSEQNKTDSVPEAFYNRLRKFCFASHNCIHYSEINSFEISNSFNFEVVVWHQKYHLLLSMLLSLKWP